MFKLRNYVSCYLYDNTCVFAISIKYTVIYIGTATWRTNTVKLFPPRDHCFFKQNYDPLSQSAYVFIPRLLGINGHICGFLLAREPSSDYNFEEGRSMTSREKIRET